MAAKAMPRTGGVQRISVCWRLQKGESTGNLASLLALMAKRAKKLAYLEITCRKLPVLPYCAALRELRLYGLHFALWDENAEVIPELPCLCILHIRDSSIEGLCFFSLPKLEHVEFINTIGEPRRLGLNCKCHLKVVQYAVTGELTMETKPRSEKPTFQVLYEERSEGLLQDMLHMQKIFLLHHGVQ